MNTQSKYFTRKVFVFIANIKNAIYFKSNSVNEFGSYLKNFTSL